MVNDGNGTANVLMVANTVNVPAKQWTKVSTTQTINLPSNPDHWFQLNAPESYEGIIKIKNDSIKIQEGATTTKPAWKPNLLAEPYEVGDVPVQPNIAPNVGLPVTTSTQLITQQTLKDYVVKGETYTVTLKGTKPANQGLRVLIAQDNGNRVMADMKPIEGLPDQWEATFTYKIDNTNTGDKELRIYQRYPERLTMNNLEKVSQMCYSFKTTELTEPIPSSHLK